LRTYLDVLRSTQSFGHFRDCGKRRNDHHFDICDFVNIAQERFHKPRRLGLRHVHLPISCDDLLAEVLCFLTRESELKINEGRVMGRTKQKDDRKAATISRCEGGGRPPAPWFPKPSARIEPMDKDKCHNPQEKPSVEMFVATAMKQSELL